MKKSLAARILSRTIQNHDTRVIKIKTISGKEYIFLKDEMLFRIKNFIKPVLIINTKNNEIEILCKEIVSIQATR